MAVSSFPSSSSRSTSSSTSSTHAQTPTFTDAPEFALLATTPDGEIDDDELASLVGAKAEAAATATATAMKPAALPVVRFACPGAAAETLALARAGACAAPSSDAARCFSDSRRRGGQGGGLVGRQKLAAAAAAAAAAAQGRGRWRLARNKRPLACAARRCCARRGTPAAAAPVAAPAALLLLLPLSPRALA